ncbi:phosphate/sulfate permease [Pseudomonas lini]|nr:phosphate/sulfate permease [Pseudomonas lini]
MPSTLTAARKDGKRSKKIEINTRKVRIVDILLRLFTEIVFMFAQGYSDAQLKVGPLASVDAAMLKASIRRLGKHGVGNERIGLEAIWRTASGGP